MILGYLAGESAVGRYYFGFPSRGSAACGCWQGISAGSCFLRAGAHSRTIRIVRLSAVLKASILLSYSVMPVACLQAAVAAPLVEQLFRSPLDCHRYPIIQLLSVGLAFDAVSWMAGGLLSARGEYHGSAAVAN